MDLPLAKLTALPFFDEAFRSSLLWLQLQTVERLVAFNACLPQREPGVFADFVMQVAPLRRPSIDDLEIVAARSAMFETLFVLVEAAKDTFLKEAAFARGFGQVEGAAFGAKTSPVMTKRSVTVQFDPKPVPAPKRARRPDPEVSPLMEMELLAKAKWIDRLEAIAIEAGPHAKLMDELPEGEGLLTLEEQRKLRRLVLAVGAFRTLEVHVRHFERFVAFCKDRNVTIFPITMDAMIKYAMFLDERSCGPTVIPSFKAAVVFVAGRLKIEVPDWAKDARLKALTERVIELRGQELKEAIPIPFDLLAAVEERFEKYVVEKAHVSHSGSMMPCM
jgi:hypothetical protein